MARNSPLRRIPALSCLRLAVCYFRVKPDNRQEFSANIIKHGRDPLCNALSKIIAHMTKFKHELHAYTRPTPHLALTPLRNQSQW